MRLSGLLCQGALLVATVGTSACATDPDSRKLASLSGTERDRLCFDLDRSSCIEADVEIIVVPSEEECKTMLVDLSDPCEVTVGQFEACVDDAEGLTVEELCNDLPTSCQVFWDAINGGSCG